MRNKVIFSLAVFGVAVGMLAAYVFGMQRKPQPPVYTPASSPYPTAILPMALSKVIRPAAPTLMFTRKCPAASPT